MKNETITIDARKTGSRAQLRRAWSEERAAAVTAKRRGDQPGEWHHLRRYGLRVPAYVGVSPTSTPRSHCAHDRASETPSMLAAAFPA